jgi:hypothetical protein
LPLMQMRPTGSFVFSLRRGGQEPAASRHRVRPHQATTGGLRPSGHRARRAGSLTLPESCSVAAHGSAILCAVSPLFTGGSKGGRHAKLLRAASGRPQRCPPSRVLGPFSAEAGLRPARNPPFPPSRGIANTLRGVGRNPAGIRLDKARAVVYIEGAGLGTSGAKGSAVIRTPSHGIRRS